MLMPVDRRALDQHTTHAIAYLQLCSPQLLQKLSSVEHIQLITIAIVALHFSHAQAGHSVLIFCGTKAHCEKVAKHIAKRIQVPERARPATAAAAAEAGDDAEAPAGNLSR